MTDRNLSTINRFDRSPASLEARKNIFVWALYDFADSIVTIVFFLYFTQWIVIDRGVSNFNFNLTFVVSAVLLFLTVPLTGLLCDAFWRRIVCLRVSTFGMALFYGLCALSALGGHETAALVCYTFALYFYQLSFTFYTPLLNDISKPEKRGIVSGLGISANYAGQFVGLLLALPFVNGVFKIFNTSARTAPLLPGVFVFALCAIPMLLFFKEPKKAILPNPYRSAVRQLFTETRLLFLFPGVAFFLLSYLLFNDGILTACVNFPLFLEKVWGVSDTTKTYLLIAILLNSGVGGAVSGLVADRWGHKRSLMVVVAGWMVILPALAVITHFTWFAVFTTLMGFWFGASWAVSRSVMSFVAPPGKLNLAFGYFGLAERTSSFFGPIVWGLIVSNGATANSAGNYRQSMFAMTAFVLLGLLALAKVKDDRSVEIQPRPEVLTLLKKGIR